MLLFENNPAQNRKSLWQESLLGSIKMVLQTFHVSSSAAVYFKIPLQRELCLCCFVHRRLQTVMGTSNLKVLEVSYLVLLLKTLQKSNFGCDNIYVSFCAYAYAYLFVQYSLLPMCMSMRA